MEYNYILTEKPVPDLMEFHSELEKIIPSFLGITIDTRGVVIVLSEEPSSSTILQIESITPPNVSQLSYVKQIISKSIIFGNNLITEFAAQNVIMGITQDGKTGIVRKNMEQVILALSTGSLYDAINEAKMIPLENKDNKYITDDRLLLFINKIETYLGIPLSDSLN